MVNFLKKIGKWAMDIIEVFVISMSVFIIIYLFLVQPHQVKGQSMHPTFKDGEYLMTDKITYRRRDPKRGEVIVFKSPVNESFDFIKRVIAGPGDTILIDDGQVYLNDNKLVEPYLADGYTTDGGRFIREGVGFTVPQGTWVVMGDNRSHSSDSREWGPVPLENFVGRGFIRYWPFDAVSWINTQKDVREAQRVK